MMNSIYQVIQDNPEFFAWAFGVVNVLWGLFMYFNKQSHDKKMEELKYNLNLDAERRKKVFEMKVNQYENYVSNLDDFGKKHQVDLPARMQPIFDKYLKDYLAASMSDDKEKEQEVITWFSSQVSGFIREGMDDLLRLQAESNKLKLTASDSLIITFDELEFLTKSSMDKVNEFMSKFTEIVMTQNSIESERYQSELNQLGAETRSKSEQLMAQMRAELAEI